MLDHDVIGVFFLTPKQWQQHDDADRKIAFTLGCLQELSDSLAKRNIPLVVKTCDDFSQVPSMMSEICKEHQVDYLFFNHEYEVNERLRDQTVVEATEALCIQVSAFHDRVVVAPENIKTKQGNFYSVFTPYRKVWDVKIGQNDDLTRVWDPPVKRASLPKSIRPSPIPKTINGFTSTNCWQEQFPAGEKSGLQKLDSFAERISGYNTDRDLPSIADGTSSLSPYLAAGAISPRQCISMVQHAKSSVAQSEGASVWISELTWRDFYTHVMIGFPRVSKHLPFKLATNQIPWRTEKNEFEAWCQGKTGFPIVDAGMRQLNETGWMHNRLRMVTAMFLTKNLLIDWRLGERYFMRNLIDGDLAANNGGWQWSASTGTDAVPYFRIFNPFSQSKRFDKSGEFIKRMCPELRSLPEAALHDPKKLSAEIERRNIDYPSFVVDYKMSRERALKAFQSLNKN